MFSYTFMQNAWIVGTLIAIISAMMGVFVVAKRMAFFGHVLSEIGFAGASFGLFMSWSPLWGMLLFTAFSAISIGQLGLSEQRSESIISAVSAVAIGLGVAFLSLSEKSASSATGILFGSIFSISTENVWQVVLLAFVILGLLLVLYRPLRHFAFDYETAKYSLQHETGLEITFLLMIAVTVAISAQVVGSLLIFILLVLPASSAMRWGRTVWQMLSMAIVFALIGVWGGLIFAYWTNLPVSFYIALIEAGIYFSSVFKAH
ncbi:metal ABC transporter permease [Weissella coleopterorum]|uniref:Metal ABC transporter permease n=1 Tax=Weissella coleopterorum TaxID=2714949 RepID=A0A6G8AY73_9LACO|nr:metal ABC transporter permease [Weissella coleopterorum]QIL50051.1 metal ABC transporter permease [Weissella coleopterorum]